ncbi:MAG: DUF2218 domain-containing protein [Acidimicrobiia bacterium]
MPASEARVEIVEPSRYVVALCKHFSYRARTLPEVEAHVEWSDDHGVANFGWGQCVLHADSGVLTLRAEAAEEANLRRVELLVSDHLERFGKRDQLIVTWTSAREDRGGRRDSHHTADGHSLEHPRNGGEAHD